jgi:hypothetical protein
MVERRGKYGTFFGCSAYTRKNPCRGKPVMRSVTELRDVCELVAFVSAEACLPQAGFRRSREASTAGRVGAEGGEKSGAFQSETVVGIDFERKSGIMEMCTV